MNKEEILKNGVATIKDHEGNLKEVTMLDNLDSILKQENIIEIIEKVISALEYSSDSFKKESIKDILYISSPILSTISVPTFMMYINTGSLEGIIDTKFGSMEKYKFLLIFMAAFSPVALRMSKNWYKEYKEEVKSENGRLLLLYQLKHNLIIQSEKLRELRIQSKEITITEDKRYSLDDENIDILQEHINLYYELGYNIKEYYQYFKTNGCLPDELVSEYNDIGVQIIEDYLKNNGSKIKKFRNKK